MSGESGFRYVVLGGGRQGRAAGLDLALHGEAALIRVADFDLPRATATADAINAGAGREVAVAVRCQVEDPASLDAALSDATACLSAVPYRFNPSVAEGCLRAGCHHADLGGDPITVGQVVGMDAEARKRGVTLVPDCGLAPGLANVLTARALELARERAGDDPDTGWNVRVRCGGLPVEPEGALGYALVFSPWGLLKEYDGPARIVRAGSIEMIQALEGREEIAFESPPGTCEAFHTVGGASTMPDSFAGRLHDFDYKTVRYPGHCEAVRMLRSLGLFGEDPVPPGDGSSPVSPRAVLVTLLERHLPKSVPDLVVLRVVVEGKGLDAPVQLDVREFGDPETGLTAMERCTGFPAAAVLHELAKGAAPPGAAPPEKAVAASPHIDAVRARGIEVRGA